MGMNHFKVISFSIQQGVLFCPGCMVGWSAVALSRYVETGIV